MVTQVDRRRDARVNLVVLDALRGLAALYVMLAHARWLLWSGYGEYTAQTHSALGLSLVTLAGAVRYGHAAVLLFFLISGFCIHYRWAQATALSKAGGFDVGSYTKRRFIRLFPPLLVALALTAVFDLIGQRINPSFYAGQSAYPLINATLSSGSHSLTTLAGNLLFQSTFIVPAFGTDAPLWSLSYEVWFYALYPVALLSLARWGLGRTFGSIAVVSLVATGVSVAAVPWWVMSVLAHWIMWFGGAMIAEGYVKSRRLRGRPGQVAVALAAVLLMLLLVDDPPRIDGTLSDLAWGLCLAVMLAYLMLNPTPRIGALIEHLARRLAPLGKISYSLYIVHFPALALIAAWWLSWHSRLPLGPELAVTGALAALALAVGCWFAVERHCLKHRTTTAAVRVEPIARTVES